MNKQTEALEMAIGVLLSINQGKQHLIVIDDDRGFFQREEWVRWAIDEVVPQIKEALEQPSVAELNDEYLRDTHVEGLQPAQEPVLVNATTHDGQTYKIEVSVKEWQGLSNDMVRAIGEKCQEENRGILNWIDFYNAFEQALKEKNNAV